jgi:arginyl-tRNA synthetase
MIVPVHERLRARVSAAVSQLYGLGPSDLPPIAVGSPPNRELGDLAITLAFELARRLHRAPRVIAQEIAGALGPVPGVARIEITPNGYLNVYLDRPAFLRERLEGRVAPPAAAGRSEKTIVEHTAINPNKAAHIGHLRNSALGDTLVRALRFQGVPVEVQNYIDDTGVQVADVIVGFRELEGMNLAEVRRVAESTRFDHYCWDLYARVTDWYEQDRERLKIRAAVLHDVERAAGDAAEIAGFITDRIVRCHLETMARINVGYDLLTWEGDILRLHFWARAFEILKEKGAVFLQTEGRLAGCWVMQIQDADGGDPLGSGEEGTLQRRSADGEEAEDAREKVIVRSNGTVTYVGKDMAYQFWKFGLLGRDFHYRVFGRRSGGTLLWATSHAATPEEAGRPSFGGATKVYNVIDVRQSYLQKLLKQGLAAIGHPRAADRSIHFYYEMVALTHATARQLGYDLSEEDASRPFVEVSGRKGLGVKADDLLDTLTLKATSEVVKRNPDLSPEESQRIAGAIATAAVRYFMVKYSRAKVIAFDIDEALNFEGESGPYLQYAVVRANNIFQKLRDREGLSESDILSTLAETPPAELTGDARGHDLWALVLEAARLDEVVEQAVRTLEFSVLAKYAFALAQMFNAFYHRYPILNEEQAATRRWRAAGVSYFRTELTRALDLMGIVVPPRM